uniref:Uncharacterized protein n=1 Tax=Ovis aries TaxID=9940 RepID=A0AC11ER14_SHEEP
SAGAAPAAAADEVDGRSRGRKQAPAAGALQGGGANGPGWGGAPSALYRTHSRADPDAAADEPGAPVAAAGTATSPSLDGGASGKSAKTAGLAPASRVHHEKHWAGRSTRWNQDCGRNINNLRYTDDTTLMAESEEELKSPLMKVKEESEKVGLKLNIRK